jgi:type IV secretory pathway protease TraF
MRRRLKIVLLMLAATMLISFPIFENPGPVLLCNASASAPVGLYRVRSIDKLRAAELDVARPPAPLANLLREGGYLACRSAAHQARARARRTNDLPCGRHCHRRCINMGSARERDHLGRKLPIWQGCDKLIESEVFLMNWPEPASLDGRYFAAACLLDCRPG